MVDVGFVHSLEVSLCWSTATAFRREMLGLRLKVLKLWAPWSFEEYTATARGWEVGKEVLFRKLKEHVRKIKDDLRQPKEKLRNV